jgi:peptide/nickel transport system permease protein
MLRYALLRAAMLAASIAGAGLLAAAIAALGQPGAAAGVADFLAAMLAKVPNVFAFNIGQSSLSGLSASIEAGPAFMASLELLLFATPIALIIGVPLGSALADPATRPIVSPIVQLTGSVPVFCAGLLIGILLARLWPAHTGTGVPSLFAAIASQDSNIMLAALEAIAPPGLTVGLAGAGAVALSWRNALEIASAEPYRDGLRRLGLGDADILRIYVVRHAIALSLDDLADIVLAFFAAAAVAEWIFAWPGAGAAFIHAVALADWAVAAVIVFVIAIIRAGADFAGPVAAHALIAEEAAL